MVPAHCPYTTLFRSQYACAVRADSLWRNRTWAEQRRSSVQSGAYARHHIEAIMDGMISDYKADGREVHAVALACNRFFWIQQLRRLGDSDFSLADQNAATNEFCAQVTGYQQQGRSDLVEREFRNAGIALWHDVPREGLDAWSEQLRIEGRANRALMNDVLQPIQSGHLALTQSVDRVYLLQSEMAATLHGMLEEYISWRRGSQGLADDATDAVIDAHEIGRASCRDRGQRTSGG